MLSYKYLVVSVLLIDPIDKKYPPTRDVGKSDSQFRNPEFATKVAHFPAQSRRARADTLLP
jgi:hypothetical protein